ncbi:ABC transporter substrate-binding protein [Roseinatronobacter monicus]|uniref:ABC transporter substrate-binding protein n=1 Tax=Roseinatronobacter monicus TaxID=393481 RepID=UPI003F39BD8F
MSRFDISRRHLMAMGLGGIGATAFGARGLMAQHSQVALQLSWLHSVQFAGSYIADEHGFWADRGLSVRLDAGGPNAPVEPPVVTGTALVGISAADYTAAAVQQVAPVRIIGVAMQNNPFAIASLPDNPVNTPKDLEGKRIGMPLANMPVLRTLATLNDVDIDAIEVIPTQYDAAPLVAGEVDCLLCWSTDLPVAMFVRDIESVTMLMADFGYTLHSQTYIATEDSIANRRAELVALMAGEVAGWNAYRDDLDAATDLTLARFPDAGLDRPTQIEQARRQVPLMFSDLTDAEGFGWFTEDTVARNIETLALLDMPVEPALWDRSILEEVHG